MSERYDVIVVGSGIGGLSAALTASRGGRNVLLLEAGKQFGGYTNPFRRRRFRFEPGLHYIGDCGPEQPFTRMLERLGIADEVRFRELSPDGFDHLVFPDYEVKMPRGAEIYRDRLAKDFPNEVRGLDRFFQTLRDMMAAIRKIQKIRGPKSALSALPHLPKLLRDLRAPYSRLLDRYFDDPLLKAVLAAQGGDIGLPPSRASALVSLGVLDHYLGGAYYPVGGGGALRDAFVKGLKETGATLKRNHAVSDIEVKNGSVHAVRCSNGKRYEADTVISNVDASQTYLDFIGHEHLPRKLQRKAENTRPSIASICLFIGTELDTAAAGMTDANIWHYSQIDLDAAYDPIWEGKLVDEPFFFLSSPSLKDPETREAEIPEHHTLEFVTLCPPNPFDTWLDSKTQRRGDGYETFKDQLQERYLKYVDLYVPGIADHLTVCDVSTPLTNISYTSSPLGSIYGPEQTPDQMGPWRFPIKGSIEGLFHCGASTLGAGIIPCGLSGNLAGNMALRA